MSTSVVCPSCSYPLLYQVTHGKLQWFCSHCRQVFPYGVEVEDQGEPQERGDRQFYLAQPSPEAIASAASSNLSHHPASRLAAGATRPSPSELRASGVSRAADATRAIAHPPTHPPAHPPANPDLERLKDDFLNTVSHELRTPLAHIKMGLRLLEVFFQKHISLDPALAPDSRTQVMRYLSMMNEACDAEISLINDLLALQHLAAGTHPVLPITITLQDWIPQLVEVIQPQTRVAPERIQIDVPSGLPNVHTDLFMLGRILTELLTNAGKFSPPHTPITISVQTTSVQTTSAQATSAQTTTDDFQGASQGAIQIRVSNLAPEIPSHQLSRIFDTFYRIPSVDPWSHSGMGLGLALVKAMTQYLGGAIWAESRLGQTIVVLNLPHLQSLDSDSDRNLLMGYVAYYLSRGQALRSPLGKRIEYTGRVYHYWGYHPDFLLFWHQLEARKDFPQLSIAKTSRCFAEFLSGSLEVRECARCGLPQPSMVGRIYGSPGCELCDLECPLTAKTALTPNAAPNDAPNIRVLAVGTLPAHAKQWREHYALNGVDIVFISRPNAIPDAVLKAPVDAVLIHQALSEAEANAWVTQLARQPALMTVPMIALSAHVRSEMPWLERSPTLEDYLVVPLSGDALLHHLRHITALQTSPPSAEPYWFPG